MPHDPQDHDQDPQSDLRAAPFNLKTILPGGPAETVQAGIVGLCEGAIEDAMQNRLERLLLIGMRPDGTLDIKMCGPWLRPSDAIGMMMVTLEAMKRKLA